MSIYTLYLGIKKLKKKTKGQTKKPPFKNKVVSTIETSLEPENTVEAMIENYQNYLRTGGRFMNKVKEFLKWCYGNKASITSLVTEIFAVVCANVMVFTEDFYSAFSFLASIEAIVKVLVPVLSGLITALWVFILVKRAFDSNTTIDDIRNRTKRTRELNVLLREKTEKLAAANTEYEKVSNFLVSRAYVVETKGIQGPIRAKYQEYEVREKELVAIIQDLEKEIIDIKDELEIL